MEIVNTLHITVGYETSCIRPKPNYIYTPTISKNIEELLETLKKEGISINKDKSEKYSVLNDNEVKSKLNEKHKKEIIKRYVLKGKNLEITLDTYCNGHNDGKIGGTSYHVEGIKGKIVYNGKDIKKAEKTIDKTKEILEKFYRSGESNLDKI